MRSKIYFTGRKCKAGTDHRGLVDCAVGILLLMCAAAPLSDASEIQVTGWGLDGISYELWGSQQACPLKATPWGAVTGYYDAPNYGYEFIGAASVPQTFTADKDYRFYVVGTRGEMQLDAVRTPKDEYLDGESYRPLTGTLNSHLPYRYDEHGNLIGSIMDYTNWEYLWDAPDGRTNNLGFPVGGGSTGGVFHGGLVFENRDALVGLYIGSNDNNGMKGQTDARNVYNAMSQLGDWEGGRIMDFHSNQTSPNAKQEIFDTLRDAEEDLQKNDVVVFFYAGHGGFSEGVGPEAMTYTGSEDQRIYDDMLASWFDGTGGIGSDRLDPTVWNDVNKLFIMDSCHAEGFWGPGDDGLDLARLPQAAILAASLETGTTGSDENGEGYLAKAVAAAFALVDHDGGRFTAADENFDGLSFEELRGFVNEFGDQYFPADGSILVNLREDGTAPFEWSIAGWASEDFQMDLIGQAPVASGGVVPTPAAVWLGSLGLGSASWLLRRSRKPC